MYGYITSNCDVDADCPGTALCDGAHYREPCSSDSGCRLPTTCEPEVEGFASCICLDDCDNTSVFTGTPMPTGAECMRNEACEAGMCYAVRGAANSCMSECIGLNDRAFRCTDNADCCSSRCSLFSNPSGLCLAPQSESEGVAEPTDPGSPTPG